MIGAWAGIPAVLTLLLSGIPHINSLWNQICRTWLTVGLWFLMFMEVSTTPFILEYDLRPNYLFFEYLIYPREVMSMLWSGHRVELLFTAMISMVTLHDGWRVFGRYNSARNIF